MALGSGVPSGLPGCGALRPAPPSGLRVAEAPRRTLGPGPILRAAEASGVMWFLVQNSLDFLGLQIARVICSCGFRKKIHMKSARSFTFVLAHPVCERTHTHTHTR